MSHMCAKGFLDSIFNYAVIGKISNFQKIDPNFAYLQKSYFLKYNCYFSDKLLVPYTFCGRDFCQLWGVD